MIAVDGDQHTVAYRKMWLSGDEPNHFEHGTEPAALTVDGWRLGLAVCKDTGIEQHAEATTARGIDAYIAGVLVTVDDAAVVDERAIRIATSHRVWIAIASFAGSTGGGYSHAAGRSGMWDPHGSVVARAGTEPGEIASATLT